MPYLGAFSQILTRGAKLFGITIVFATAKTVKTTLKSPKAPVSEAHQSSVVYCITCDCQKLYIGQTGREFATRRDEHRQNWRHGRGAFVDHLSPDHLPHFDSATVLATSSSLEIRELKEAFLIAQAGNFAISNANIGFRSAVNRLRGRNLNGLWNRILTKFSPLPKYTPLEPPLETDQENMN